MDGVVYGVGINRNVIVGVDFDNFIVINNLEEKFVFIFDSKNEEMIDYVKKFVYEEKLVISFKVL